MYELRHDSSPSAMPGGTGTISRHRLLDRAVRRYHQEARRRIPAHDRARGAWFPAIIIDTSTGERIDPRHQ
jgi:hypothetical protein